MNTSAVSSVLGLRGPPPLRAREAGNWVPVTTPHIRRRPEHPPPLPLQRRERLESVDLLRGLVMVVMCLDHVRDFFASGTAMNPRDVTDPALFLTRWVTHFCAPTFVLLAGMSAFLHGRRDGRTTRDLSRYLLTRGVWLIAAELTLVNFGWTFNPRFEWFTLQVIWTIGCAMVVLAGLVFLPRAVIAAVAVAMIAGHNLLDGVRAESLGRLAPLWMVLHEPGVMVTSPRFNVYALYPLFPWVGVMALGYGLGPVLCLSEARYRRRRLRALGFAFVLAFAVLRGMNLYGDPAARVEHDAWWATLLSVLDCEKYPPSLLYLLMTLGPALIALAAFDRAKGWIADVFVTFGRVPFLYYLAHVYLIHALAVIAAWLAGVELAWLFRHVPPMNKPEGFGVGLGWVYAIWLGVVAALYPLCRWFADVKRRRCNDWWLSYL